MSKRLLITEEEKSQIKSLYNVDEQLDFESIISGLRQKLSDFKSGDLYGKIKNVLSPTETENIDLSKVNNKGKELLKNPQFNTKLDEISKSINIDKDSIIKLMNHESGLDPKIKNSIGCVGLIQFCPDKRGGSTKTIGGKLYNLEELRNNLDSQMTAIKDFWVTGYKSGKIKEPKDLYIYNFFPVAAGKSDNFVLQTKNLSPEKIAVSNPIFNRVLGKPKNSPLTVGDLESYYRKTGMV